MKAVWILELVEALLIDIGINSHIVLPNGIVIISKKELCKFQAEINFSPGVCINGSRTNSIWKERLEKRELLQRAPDSFKV